MLIVLLRHNRVSDGSNSRRILALARWAILTSHRPRCDERRMRPVDGVIGAERAVSAFVHVTRSGRSVAGLAHPHRSQGTPAQFHNNLVV